MRGHFKPHTKEAKKKISLANSKQKITLKCIQCSEQFLVRPSEKDRKYCSDKCLKNSDEFKDKIKKKIKLLWQNPEYRNNMIEKHRGKKMHPNTRKALIKALKGRKLSPEHIQKIIEFNTGRKHTEEQNRKNGDAHRGEKAANWKGGISIGENKKEYKRFKCLERWARKNNAEGSHTIGEWELLKKQYGYKCPCCKRNEPEITLTEDHIIPLTKGGSNLIENIQPLCKNCNSKKHIKIIRYNQ